MAHRITQIKTDGNAKYMTSIFKLYETSPKISKYETALFKNTIKFTDKLLEAPLLKGTPYFVEIKIKCQKVEQYVIISLTDAQVEDTQMVGQYAVSKISSTAARNGEEEYALFRFVVTPFSDYKFILVQLERDKTNINNGTEVDVVAYNCLRIENLLSPNEQVVKIGIQGPPGLLMCINQEGIRMGPSGIYEIKNSQIKINFFGVILTNAQKLDEYGNVKTFFLVDIEYVKKTNN